MKCKRCNRDFPDELINQMFVSDKQGSGYISCCPLCALSIRNKMHGMGQEQFGGEIARDNFNRARQHVIASGQKLTRWEKYVPE